MIFILLISSIISKSVSVHFTEKTPVIDGFIEEIWEKGDSAYNFVQSLPYEGAQPSDETVVYLLQDDNNLYVAFRCWTRNTKPLNRVSTRDDMVVLFIDPFGSKTNAYAFYITVSGIYDDCLILDDNRTADVSWDGVWEYAVKTYQDRYEVEIKIPFKSIRYKKCLNEWGINFRRYIAEKRETDYWTEVLQREGNLVSKYGMLNNITPKSKGYYFEIYPEFFVRYDKDSTERIKPNGSLNLKWDITSQTTLNTAIFPDFAQIESDPFTLNLTRYETRLQERRPFFIEGSEIFSPPSGDYFTPLNLFYSRRIGKSISNMVVPIICGIKLTNKSKNLSYGFLTAFTDILKNGNEIIESQKGFFVMRGKVGIFKNSDIGILLNGMKSENGDYNYSTGFDGAIRSGVNQFVFQGAFSDRNRKRGYAFSSEFSGFIKDFKTNASILWIHDSFDVKDIGYVPWVGTKGIIFMTGPYKTFKKGKIRTLSIQFGGSLTQESGEENISKQGKLHINTNFRNNLGIDIDMRYGLSYELNMNYLARSGSLSFWGNSPSFSFWLGGNINYSYNYYRGFLAYSGSVWQGFVWYLLPKIMILMNSSSWIEWDTLNSIISIWPEAIPRIEITINPKMRVEIFNEFVFTVPGTNFYKTKIYSNRFGFLFSYNFRPKSWLYIALNDYREVEDILKIRNQIGAIKVKYLFYF